MITWSILFHSVADPDPGSGAFLTPGFRIVKKSRSGPGKTNPDHISESLGNNFLGLKYLNFDADPGWKKFGSGIKIPDLQHCNFIPSELSFDSASL
jgi:hypothetical protein